MCNRLQRLQMINEAQARHNRGKARQEEEENSRVAMHDFSKASNSKSSRELIEPYALERYTYP